MKWKPFNSGTPYTCKDCPAYAELQAEIERERAEWSIWKMTAEHLARELGKVEYAEATYDDVYRAVRGD